MMSKMVRVTPGAHRALLQMARQSNLSLQQMLEEAIENQRRQLILENANAGYAKLRANKKAWRSWKRDLHALDTTVADGI
jgi:hypothetical protein